MACNILHKFLRDRVIHSQKTRCYDKITGRSQCRSEKYAKKGVCHYMKLPYKPTPLMEQIYKQVIQQGHPNAFAIANFGEGPMLTYRKRKCWMNLLSISLMFGGQHIELSHLSAPPYFIALVQEKPDQPILTVFYQADPDPVLEQSVDHRLTGQVFAYGQSPDGSVCNIAHAVYLPEHSHVFVSAGRRNSLLMESHPELCSHLLLCGEMIETLLHQKGGRIPYGQ